MPILSSLNINNSALIIPDTYVEITPASQLSLFGVPSNLAAFVGTASWGPLNTPVNGSVYGDYLLNFGQLNARKFDMGTHVASAVQQGMNNFECVRVSDGTDTSASVAVGSTNITFTAKYTGTQGNNISVTVGNGSKANTFRFVVFIAGFAAETFDNIGPTNAVITAVTTASTTSSTTITVPTAGIVVGDVITGTGASGTVASITNSTTLVASVSQTTIASGATLTFTPSYAQNWANCATGINVGQNSIRGPSSWITATAGSGTTIPSVGTTYTLVGGTDGVATITSAVLVGSSPGVGMYALSGSGFALLDVCDADASTSWTTIDSFALSESGYAIQVAPAGNTVSQTVTAKQTAGLDSYNSKLCHGDWLYWADPVLQINRLISPQGFVIGRLANLSPQLTGLNKELAAVVGSQKSGLLGSGATAPYAQGDLNSLVTNGIEVVCNPAAGGIHIWSMRFGHNSSSNPTIHLDSYTTLTNYIAKTLNSGMGAYLGRTVTPQLFLDVTATLTQYAQTLKGAGLIGKSDGTTPYGIICNTSNNPTYQIQQGIVEANVTMSYLGILEKFIINLENGTEITVITSVISNT